MVKVVQFQVKSQHFPFKGNEKLHLNYKFAGDISFGFDTAAYGVMFINDMAKNILMDRPKAAIWYATETGSSKR